MRILIFEPNLDTSKITKRLCNFRHNFVIALSTESAFEMLNDHRIDMIIMSSELREPECNRFYQSIQAYLQRHQAPIIQLIDGSHLSATCVTHESSQVAVA